MAREVVETPVPFPQSFQQTDDAAAQSQAAVLLTLGNFLRFEDRFAMSALAAEQPSPAPADILPPEDREALNIPRGIVDLSAARGVRLDANFVRERLAAFGLGLQGMAAEPPGEAMLPALPALADRLNEQPANPLAAADLLQASLSSPDELVRVSAASSYLEVALPEQREPLIQILVEGTRSDDELTRDVAATALARAVPGHPRLRELMTPLPYSANGEPSQTSLMVHGTWARNNDWW
jgi:HEAT repeat protein